MTAARSLLDLTVGEFNKLNPEDQKHYTEMLLQMWRGVDQYKLQREHQKDHDEEIADQYLGGRRED